MNDELLELKEFLEKNRHKTQMIIFLR